MKKKILNLSTIISVMFMLWFVASFIDVNLYNTPFTDNYGQFANWNLFAILFN